MYIYILYGVFGSSLLLESTDSMIMWGVGEYANLNVVLAFSDVILIICIHVTAQGGVHSGSDAVEGVQLILFTSKDIKVSPPTSRNCKHSNSKGAPVVPVA